MANNENNKKVPTLAQMIEAHKKSNASVKALDKKVEDLKAAAMTEERVTAAINAKVSSTYKAGGSVAFADLPELSEANMGLVVNVTDKFTTTDDFVEGAGNKHSAGTNVAVVLAGEVYKYDVMSGFVDLSGLVEKEDGKGLSEENFTAADKAKLDGIEFATDEEVAAALAEIYGKDETEDEDGGKIKVDETETESGRGDH